VREWRKRDYQTPVLKRASLIDAARKRDWSKLPEMLAYVESQDCDEVFSTSLIRLMAASADERVTAVLLTALKDPSPLVRAAAAETISLRPSREGVQALLDATGDDYRLVRTRAVAGLAGYPLDSLPDEVRTRVEKANKEYLVFIMARPDQWTSHYNMGNYQLSRGKLREAIASYRSALKLEPEAVLAMVNLSIAYAQNGENDKADKSLQEALRTAPDSAAANFNMGLVKAEKNEPKQAEKYLKKAFKADPQMAQAAYNLCIITAKDRIHEAVNWCRKASGLRPDEPKYAFTLAYYMNQKGDKDEAVRMLKALIEKYPGYRDAEMLLQEISSGKQ
jgi:tetratricopeptide (TPR) repeat protein